VTAFGGFLHSIIKTHIAIYQAWIQCPNVMYGFLYNLPWGKVKNVTWEIYKKTLSEFFYFSPTLKSSIIYACINIAMEMWSYPFQDVFAVK
jgi:hypothetical protein